MNLETLCEGFYASHFIPTIILNNNEIEKIYCSYDCFKDLFNNYKNRFTNIKKYPAVVNSSTLGLYGIVKDHKTDKLIIFGPIYSRVPDKDDLLRFISKSFANTDDEEELLNFLRLIPNYNYNHFINLLTFVEYIINNNQIQITDVFFDEKVQDSIYSKQIKSEIDYNTQEHGTYYFEQEMVDYISKGDVVGLKTFLMETIKRQKLNEGKLASNELRQAKNLLIGSLVLMGKIGAIKGGLDIEETYNLIDIYTQECENCHNIDEVKNLQYNALMDFTTRVSKNNKNKEYSNDVNIAIEYIKTHLNTPIQIMNIVCYVGISRTNLLNKFKKETNETIGNYIMKCRLEKSKMLLKYSNISLGEISSYLCFSSQSYFQNKFKQMFKITPLKYRKEEANKK